MPIASRAQWQEFMGVPKMMSDPFPKPVKVSYSEKTERIKALVELFGMLAALSALPPSSPVHRIYSAVIEQLGSLLETDA